MKNLVKYLSLFFVTSTLQIIGSTPHENKSGIQFVRSQKAITPQQKAIDAAWCIMMNTALQKGQGHPDTIVASLQFDIVLNSVSTCVHSFPKKSQGTLSLVRPQQPIVDESTSKLTTVQDIAASLNDSQS